MKSLIIKLVMVFVYISVHAQDYALKQLESSPRHQEWVDIKTGGRTLHCFVVYPEKASKTPAIIIIHENRGLTDWVRSFADQLAGAGYIAIAPDLLSDFSEDKKTTGDFSSDDARKAIYELNPDQVTSDLNALEVYAQKIPSANGKTAVIGFCWGGSQSFRFATNNKNIKAVLVFYGSAPEKNGDLEKITAPVYGFYGENDNRINAGIDKTKELMTKAGKKYDFKIYRGAGHAYMRQGDDPSSSAELKKAKDDSWVRIKEILAGI